MFPGAGWGPVSISHCGESALAAHSLPAWVSLLCRRNGEEGIKGRKRKQHRAFWSCLFPQHTCTHIHAHTPFLSSTRQKRLTSPLQDPPALCVSIPTSGMEGPSGWSPWIPGLRPVWPSWGERIPHIDRGHALRTMTALLQSRAERGPGDTVLLGVSPHRQALRPLPWRGTVVPTAFHSELYETPMR